MKPGTLVLLHSPLTGAAAWGELPDLLRADGTAVVAVEVADDQQPPYATRYVAAAALQTAAGVARPDDAVVLVGHSGAGPLLAQVGFARRAARGVVGGYLFLDAGLPRPGRAASRLDLMTGEDPVLAAELRAALKAGARFPAWSDTDLREVVPDDGDRAVLLASLRPRGLDFFTEPLPVPVDWPDAPCGVLRTSEGYDYVARLAAGRHWPVESVQLGHFAALAHPLETARSLRALLARM